GLLAATVSPADSHLRSTCSIPRATLTDGNRSGRSYTYTDLGELKDVTECVDGKDFVTSFEYDQLGRASVIRYPQVGTERLAVEYHYSALGFLYYITNQADGSLYWAATRMNARGEVTDEYTGNGVQTISNRNDVTGWLMGSTSTAHADGDNLIQLATYQYDQIGNLTSRTRADASSAAAFTETFTYDALNRLSTATTSSPTQHSERYLYDDQGLGNITEKGGQTYTYTGCTAGPHAVCTVGTGSPFVYDDNGNVVRAADRRIEYNAANKTTHIENTATSETIDFVYDADGNRVVQEVGTVGAPAGSSARTVYVGLGSTGKSLYERTTRGDSVEHTQFIYAGSLHGGNALALRVTSESGGTESTATKYNHFDHLGSVTTMSDETGHAVGLSYDAFGARRDPSGQAADASSLALQPGHREFTGHEAIPGMGLVNMNGRVYDPLLGRFLSPDPNVQFGGDLQSYNRYTYVGNNPLRYTDPTGYFWGERALNFVLKFSWTLTETIGVAAFCASSAGAGCIGAMLFFAALNSAIAYGSGASWSQVAQVAAITVITEEAAILTAGAATLPGEEMIFADATIGFAQGVTTAKLSGASDMAALKAGLLGAAIAGGSAALTVASSHLAEEGIPSDAKEGDYYAGKMEDNGYAKTAAKPHAFPNHEAGEGYSIGPNEANYDITGDGAYKPFNRWFSDNVPFSNYGGYVQDGIDFNPQTNWEWVQWAGYFLTAQTMTYGGAALATTGGISAVVQFATD
ncbi:MAG TPA: RHS repeat-associated core domain-containing protein, partial [Polyangia bacterium]|nr:RHS repeat-associated core domain-containing protein [Polyangia bacterium]